MTEHPVIMITKKSPPPMKKPRNAKTRLETLVEYLVESQSDIVAKNIHPSP